MELLWRDNHILFYELFFPNDSFRVKTHVCKFHLFQVSKTKLQSTKKQTSGYLYWKRLFFQCCLSYSGQKLRVAFVSLLSLLMFHRTFNIKLHKSWNLHSPSANLCLQFFYRIPLARSDVLAVVFFPWSLAFDGSGTKHFQRRRVSSALPETCILRRKMNYEAFE